jgi:hypothetical protein
MYLCGAHIISVNIPPRKDEKKYCLFLKSGRDVRDLMPTYGCIPPTHSKSVGPKSTDSDILKAMEPM